MGDHVRTRRDDNLGHRRSRTLSDAAWAGRSAASAGRVGVTHAPRPRARGGKAATEPFRVSGSRSTGHRQERAQSEPRGEKGPRCDPADSEAWNSYPVLVFARMATEGPPPGTAILPGMRRGTNRPARPLSRRAALALRIQKAASSFGATCFLRLITPGRSISPLRCSHSNLLYRWHSSSPPATGSARATSPSTRRCSTPTVSSSTGWAPASTTHRISGRAASASSTRPRGMEGRAGERVPGARGRAAPVQRPTGRSRASRARVDDISHDPRVQRSLREVYGSIDEI